LKIHQRKKSSPDETRTRVIQFKTKHLKPLRHAVKSAIQENVLIIKDDDIFFYHLLFRSTAYNILCSEAHCMLIKIELSEKNDPENNKI